MKKTFKKSVIFGIAVVLFISITIGILLFNTNIGDNKIIQLSAQSSRQMMGYIIITKNNNLIVIDGGTTEDTENLVKQIKNNGGQVDAWFLTHIHDDHVGAFTEIINNESINVKKIYVSINEFQWYEENEPTRIEFTNKVFDLLSEENIKQKIEEVFLNQIITIDNIKAEILGIKNPEITQNAGNEQSMVIKFDSGKTTFLVLGDTGENSSKKLLEKQKDKLKSNIVQMAHHGQAGATEELYNEIKPNICLWPTLEWLWNNDAGQGENSGEWKTFETRNWMKELKVNKNYVSKDGDLTIKIK